MNLYDKVHNSDWDTLIVLDACRFDYFKEFYSIYPNIQDGSLEKIQSIGSATPETVPKLFPNYYDYYVLSGHHWISESSGPIQALENDNMDTWEASKHFEEIESMLSNNQFNTVKPVTSGQQIIDNSDKLNNNKSLIWLMQPHSPYVGAVQFNLNRFFPWKMFVDKNGIKNSLKKLIRAAYKFNLLEILYSLSVSIHKLDGKVVITSDHGELLFDNGSKQSDYGHPYGNRQSELIDIPWLELEADKMVNPLTLSDEEYVNLFYKSVLGREVDEAGLKEYGSMKFSERNGERLKTRLPLILLHSDEYKNNFSDPNEICGVDEYSLSENGNNKIPFTGEESKSTTEQLKALGYIEE